MKAVYFIPPAAALILVGAWNLWQMREISLLEQERAALRQRIAAASKGNQDPENLLAKRASEKPGAGERDTIDWNALSNEIGRAREAAAMGDMRAMMLFQQRLEGMSTEDLVAAMDELAGLDIPAEAKRMLEGLIIDPLIDKDPELALTRFGNRIQNEPDSLGWQLSRALKDWARSDLAAATSWFDEQIANGSFTSKTLDGRSDLRMRFEGALLESLLSIDLEAASRRLAAITDVQRREILQQIPFDGLAPETQKSYTALVRNLVPPEERAGSFAYIATELVAAGGFADVGAFLDGVHASPEERAAAAKDAAISHLEQLGSRDGVTAQDVDAMRSWLKLQVPDAVDSITGKALADAAQERGGFKFADAAQLALQYHQSSGNDDVLAAFLASYSAHSNLDEAKHLAEMITDGKRRAEILKGLE
ncbi:MAG: hypothetical protein ABI600_00785 [Luteolibacter sp.]